MSLRYIYHYLYVLLHMNQGYGSMRTLRHIRLLLPNLLQLLPVVFQPCFLTLMCISHPESIPRMYVNAFSIVSKRFKSTSLRYNVLNPRRKTRLIKDSPMHTAKIMVIQSFPVYFLSITNILLNLL